MLRSIFLVAGILLLSNRLSPTYYVNTGGSIFHYAHHSANSNNNRRPSAGLAKHHKSPLSTPDKRYEIGSDCVIVSSNWTLAPAIPAIPERCTALPATLSFPHLTSLSLRGPPQHLS